MELSNWRWTEGRNLKLKKTSRISIAIITGFTFTICEKFTHVSGLRIAGVVIIGRRGTTQVSAVAIGIANRNCAWDIRDAVGRSCRVRIPSPIDPVCTVFDGCHQRHPCVPRIDAIQQGKNRRRRDLCQSTPHAGWCHFGACCVAVVPSFRWSGF